MSPCLCDLFGKGPTGNGLPVQRQCFSYVGLFVLACISTSLHASQGLCFAANILLRRARRLRALLGDQKIRSQSENDQGEKALGKVVTDSFVILMKIFLVDPAVAFTNIFTSLIYGIYCSFFEAFPLTYVNKYGFNLGELGIVFTCIKVGCVIGLSIYISYVYWYLEPDIMENGLRAQEHRLLLALGAVFLMPIGLFWFGW